MIEIKVDGFYHDGKIVERDKILFYLRDACEIDEGVNLRHIFKTVNRYPILKSFISQYSRYDENDIDQLHQTAELAPKNEQTAEPLEYLEIAGFFTDNKNCKITNDYAEYNICFSGVHCIKDIKEYERRHCHEAPESMMGFYSLGAITVNEYAQLPIKIAPFTIHDIDFDKSPVMTERKREYDYSFLEVLDAIYYEVTFYGVN